MWIELNITIEPLDVIRELEPNLPEHPSEVKRWINLNAASLIAIDSSTASIHGIIPMCALHCNNVGDIERINDYLNSQGQGFPEPL